MHNSVFRTEPLPYMQRTTSSEKSVEPVRYAKCESQARWELNGTDMDEIIDSLWKESQVAELLNCSRRHVGNLRVRGTIRFLRVGGMVRFIPTHVQEDIRRLEMRRKSQ